MKEKGQVERIALLQAMPIFGGIRADALELLLHSARRVEFPAGEFFYRQGDPASSVFVLERGRVMLLKRWRGDDYELKVLESGDCFGEVALIDLQPRNTSVLALEDCVGFEIRAADLHQLYEREVEQFALIQMNMAREVCRRLREADERAFEADMSARRVEREQSGS